MANYKKCPQCGAKMDKYDTFWDCPECGEMVMNPYYERLERQNEQWIEKNLSDNVPEGCAACGGPYSSCKISCPIFDD